MNSTLGLCKSVKNGILEIGSFFNDKKGGIMASVMALHQKPTASALDESNTSITLKIKGGARLCIEKDTGQLFKLFYGEADDSGRHELNQIGTVRLDDLKESLSVLGGCLGSATIKTKIGDLHATDYKQAGRLRKWLASNK
ncbi:MAG TPA: hypothetical protein DCZ83_03755 [Candidatus Yonathbacteria bacterium]|nr:hypothetical protein [Candidatus Yonathbacteria bacterium]